MDIKRLAGAYEKNPMAFRSPHPRILPRQDDSTEKTKKKGSPFFTPTALRKRTAMRTDSSVKSSDSGSQGDSAVTPRISTRSKATPGGSNSKANSGKKKSVTIVDDGSNKNSSSSSSPGLFDKVKALHMSSPTPRILIDRFGAGYKGKSPHAGIIPVHNHNDSNTNSNTKKPSKFSEEVGSRGVKNTNVAALEKALQVEMDRRKAAQSNSSSNSSSSSNTEYKNNSNNNNNGSEDDESDSSNSDSSGSESSVSSSGSDPSDSTSESESESSDSDERGTRKTRNRKAKSESSGKKKVKEKNSSSKKKSSSMLKSDSDSEVDDRKKVKVEPNLEKPVARRSSNRSTPAKGSTRAASNANAKKPTERSLRRWCPRVVLIDRKGGDDASNFQLVADGYLDDNTIWHTSHIAKVVAKTTLQTTKGSVYHLKGQIDEKTALNAGYSKAFIRVFKNGYPSDWNNRLIAETRRIRLAKKSAAMKKSPAARTPKTAGRSTAAASEREVEAGAMMVDDDFTAPPPYTEDDMITTDDEDDDDRDFSPKQTAAKKKKSRATGGKSSNKSSNKSKARPASASGPKTIPKSMKKSAAAIAGTTRRNSTGSTKDTTKGSSSSGRGGIYANRGANRDKAASATKVQSRSRRREMKGNTSTPRTKVVLFKNNVSDYDAEREKFESKIIGGKYKSKKRGRRRKTSKRKAVVIRETVIETAEVEKSRRSGRVRMPPMQFWTNARPIYKGDRTAVGFTTGTSTSALGSKFDALNMIGRADEHKSANDIRADEDFSYYSSGYYTDHGEDELSDPSDSVSPQKKRIRRGGSNVPSSAKKVSARKGSSDDDNDDNGSNSSNSSSSSSSSSSQNNENGDEKKTNNDDNGHDDDDDDDSEDDFEDSVWTRRRTRRTVNRNAQPNDVVSTSRRLSAESAIKEKEETVEENVKNDSLENNQSNDSGSGNDNNDDGSGDGEAETKQDGLGEEKPKSTLDTPAIVTRRSLRRLSAISDTEKVGVDKDNEREIEEEKGAESKEEKEEEEEPKNDGDADAMDTTGDAGEEGQATEENNNNNSSSTEAQAEDNSNTEDQAEDNSNTEDQAEAAMEALTATGNNDENESNEKSDSDSKVTAESIAFSRPKRTIHRPVLYSQESGSAFTSTGAAGKSGSCGIAGTANGPKRKRSTAEEDSDDDDIFARSGKRTRSASGSGKGKGNGKGKGTGKGKVARGGGRRLLVDDDSDGDAEGDSHEDDAFEAEIDDQRREEEMAIKLGKLTKAQAAKFDAAMSDITIDPAKLWETIAERVGRSISVCRAHHNSLRNMDDANSHAPAKAEEEKSPAKVGFEDIAKARTKAQRQAATRRYLKRRDHEHTDDFFESTPMKKAVGSGANGADGIILNRSLDDTGEFPGLSIDKTPKNAATRADIDFENNSVLAAFNDRGRRKATPMSVDYYGSKVDADGNIIKGASPGDPVNGPDEYDSESMMLSPGMITRRQRRKFAADDGGTYIRNARRGVDAMAKQMDLAASSNTHIKNRGEAIDAKTVNKALAGGDTATTQGYDSADSSAPPYSDFSS